MSVKDQERYTRAMHAMQSGVAMEMNYRAQPTEPKHLRVGINSAMINDAGLTKLLMAKGLFTQDEYEKAIADAAEEEAERYKQRVNQHFGTDGTINLG